MPKSLAFRKAIILTSLSIEYQTVCTHLKNLREEVYKGTVYERGDFSVNGSQWEVGVVQIEAGNVATASEAERAIAYFDPEVVLFVGLADGLKDVRVGDVVAATKVYGYEFGQVDTSFQPRPEVGNSTYAMQQRARAEARKNNWLERAGETHVRNLPRIFVAPITAGEKALLSTRSTLWKLLQTHYGDSLAVEKEGYGLLHATHANQHVESLIIRGISSIIGVEDTTVVNISQELAARHASAFAFEVLAKMGGKNETVVSQTKAQTKQTSQRESNNKVDKPKVNVLLIFANPYITGTLRLGTEERAIREAIRLSKNRDNIHLTTCSAATIHDLRRALLDDTFQVVQISGHGGSNGLVLENETGGVSIVPQRALAKLLHTHESLQCVILNACYSITQGNLVSQVVPFTVAMEGSMNDRAAIEFSRGFYDAIGAKRTVEFAYEQGCLAIELTVDHLPRRPQLLKRGEVHVSESLDESDDASRGTIEQMHFKDVKALVGVAIDLSGSMAESIRNETGETLSRLESVRDSLSELTTSARTSIRQSRAKNIQNSLDVFIYGFGLRPDTIAVCDLLSLFKASRQIITKDIIEDVTQRYKNEKQDTYSGYSGLGDFARQLGFGNAVDAAEGMATRSGQKAIRRRIWHEVRKMVEKQLQRVGDTTLPIEEVAELWGESEDVLGNAEELLFGNTPITEALISTTARFKREMLKRSKDTRLILFLVSDGKYLNVNPLPFVEKLRAMGVTIFSCFVTDKDSASPRELLNTPKAEWEQGAKMMFEMASPLDEGTEIEHFLLRKGWSIQKHPKLFVQVNHSDVLKEFVRVVLSQLEDTNAVHTLPRGW